MRLPPDTSKRDRRQVVAQVLEELKLTPHAKTRVDRLSGGQRKRGFGGDGAKTVPISPTLPTRDHGLLEATRAWALEVMMIGHDPASQRRVPCMAAADYLEPHWV